MATIGQQKANRSKTGSYTSASGKVYTSNKTSKSLPSSSGSSGSTPLYGDAARVSALAQSLGASKDTAEGAVRTTLAKGSTVAGDTPLTPETPQTLAPTTPIKPTSPTTPITPVPTTPTPSNMTREGWVGSSTNMTREGWTPTSTGTDLASTYRNVGATPPKGVDTTNAADSKQAVGTALTTAQGTPVPPGGQEIMDYYDNDENKDLANIEKAYNDFYTPKNQKDSLMNTYKTMVKDSGLADINAELIDAKRIINGTEDDIRTEITKAGGFATESQVQGMTNARNKSLIANYNTLLETKNAITEQIGNMMQYAQADRTYAAQQFESRMNFEMKKIEYGQQARQYASSQLQKIADKVGYAGLLAMTGNDPYTTSKIEQALGLGQGGLSQLASYTPPEEPQTELERAQIANIYSQINERSNTANQYGTLSGKPQNASQSAANSYANRMNESNVLLTNLGGQFTGKLAIGGSLPNILQSGDRQSYEQAKKNFITAALRRESGASIAPSEFKTAEEMYFPVAGDKPETVTQKEKTRNTVINNFYKEADVLRPVLPGQIIESDGKRYKVGLDGETLEEI